MRSKLLAMTFLVVVAINAIAFSATASAEIKLLTSFLPEPTAVKPVTFTIKGGPGELVPLKEKLEGAGTIKCKKHTGKGELTSLTLGKGEIKYEECSNSLLGTCEDLTKALSKGIVAKGELHLLTGLLKGKEVPAIVLLPEPLHFSCGIVLFLILAGSCTAGEILEPNKLTKVVKALWTEEENTEGDPDIPIIGEANEKHTEVKCEIKFNLSEGETKDAAITSKTELEAEGFKQGGVAIEALIMF